jgi:nitrilase
MPLPSMAMSAKNIQLHCTPTADDRATRLPTVQHVALEGRCFVLSCNQFTRRRDFPADFPLVQGDDPGTVIRRGGSCIVDPLGQALAQSDFEGETILTAEIDLGEIVRSKYDFDVVGHDTQPDVFRLYVNEPPPPPVVAAAGVPEDLFAEKG